MNNVVLIVKKKSKYFSVTCEIENYDDIVREDDKTEIELQSKTQYTEDFAKLKFNLELEMSRK